MNARTFTLIDVMLGIRKHGIITKLSKESFTFLIGLILEHNEVGFKDDFNLTNAQAQSIGGGNNRQSVKRRRDAIAKFEIDGESLLEFETGNFGQNTCCKYKIRYDLLCRYNQVWTDENGLPSQICNGSRDGVRNSNGTVPVTEPVTILRSEEKREEEKNTEVVVDSEKSEKEKSRDRSMEVEYLQDRIMEAFHPQLTTKPSYSTCRSVLDTYGFDVMEASAIEARGKALNNPTPQAALNYVRGIARNSQSGLTYQQRSKIARKLKELKKEWMDAEAETDPSHFRNGDKAGVLAEIQADIDRLKQAMGG